MGMHNWRRRRAINRIRRAWKFDLGKHWNPNSFKVSSIEVYHDKDSSARRSKLFFTKIQYSLSWCLLVDFKLSFFRRSFNASRLKKIVQTKYGVICIHNTCNMKMLIAFPNVEISKSGITLTVLASDHTLVNAQGCLWRQIAKRPPHLCTLIRSLWATFVCVIWYTYYLTVLRFNCKYATNVTKHNSIHLTLRTNGRYFVVYYNIQTIASFWRSRTRAFRKASLW